MNWKNIGWFQSYVEHVMHVDLCCLLPTLTLRSVYFAYFHSYIWKCGIHFLSNSSQGKRAVQYMFLYLWHIPHSTDIFTNFESMCFKVMEWVFEVCQSFSVRLQESTNFSLTTSSYSEICWGAVIHRESYHALSIPVYVRNIY
jgi:hypothetical protein